MNASYGGSSLFSFRRNDGNNGLRTDHNRTPQGQQASPQVQNARPLTSKITTTRPRIIDANDNSALLGKTVQQPHSLAQKNITPTSKALAVSSNFSEKSIKTLQKMQEQYNANPHLTSGKEREIYTKKAVSSDGKSIENHHPLVWYTAQTDNENIRVKLMFELQDGHNAKSKEGMLELASEGGLSPEGLFIAEQIIAKSTQDIDKSSIKNTHNLPEKMTVYDLEGRPIKVSVQKSPRSVDLESKTYKQKLSDQHTVGLPLKEIYNIMYSGQIVPSGILAAGKERANIGILTAESVDRFVSAFMEKNGTYHPDVDLQDIKSVLCVLSFMIGGGAPGEKNGILQNYSWFKDFTPLLFKTSPEDVLYSLSKKELDFLCTPSKKGEDSLLDSFIKEHVKNIRTSKAYQTSGKDDMDNTEELISVMRSSIKRVVQNIQKNHHNPPIPPETLKKDIQACCYEALGSMTVIPNAHTINQGKKTTMIYAEVRGEVIPPEEKFSEKNERLIDWWAANTI
jgi:hypothetical protein